MKHQVIEKGLMVPCQGPEFIWEGKGHKEVLDREEFFVLSVEPDRGLMILALRATAMATGTGLAFGVIAFGAMDEEFACLGCAAGADCLDGTQMPWQKP
jgi:hypothetical protein